jgi:hypothetical protein
MVVRHSIEAPSHSDCELRIGASSWDRNERSITFTWFDKLGHPCGGGEVPMTALVDLVIFAHERGELNSADLKRLRTHLWK